MACAPFASFTPIQRNSTGSTFQLTFFTIYKGQFQLDLDLDSEQKEKNKKNPIQLP